ncbi:NB-ARC domain-containing protein [Lentzea sp. HUAS12]|uniref:ATP-binding protein n=1 Tax=Lentzea sp. HUAS12 TaxID=2951806 RepID=UPI00209D8438|nr:helix-turn-helix domain-containing protein [Lentzea sp. HUAS12]USX55526.1 NB-ARC domain-containing protein [Lentzea sp. HUAS12]
MSAFHTVTSGSTFGEVLLSLRTAAGLSQAGLALTSGMSVRALRELERGRANAPQQRSTELLADALGLTGDARQSFLSLARQGRRRSTGAVTGAALRRLPAVPGFVGRQQELLRLSREAETGGVVVIAGPPGIGKTSLAVAAANELLYSFPDGCLALDLRGVDDHPLSPAAALEQMLASLDVPPGRMPVTLEERSSLFRKVLRSRRVLVLLDNASDEGQIRPLLTMSEGCLTIVTCRRVLAGLESARWVLLDTLTQDGAVELVAAVAGEQVVREEPEAVRELVALCGNLPLAVRMVCTRLAVGHDGRSAAALAGALRDERRLLDSLSMGDADLRTAFSTSYQALSPRARSVFRRLAVVPGVHFDDDLAAVATGVPVAEVGLVLDELVEVSLLTITTESVRFQFHDLIRIFARERRLEEEPQDVRDELRDAFATHVLDLASTAGRLFFPDVLEVPRDCPFRSYEEAAEWLDREASNWSAVQREAAALGRHRQVLDFAVSIHCYAIGREQKHRWNEVFEFGLHAARALRDRRGEAEMLNLLGATQHRCTDEQKLALTTLREAVAVAEEIGHRRIVMSAKSTIGLVLAHLGEFTEALEHITFAYEGSGEFDYFQHRVWTSLGLAVCLLAAGRFADALEQFASTLDQTRQNRDQTNQETLDRMVALLLMLMGDCLSALGRWKEAADSYHGARTIGALQMSYRTEGELALSEGVARRRAGEVEQARACLTFALGKLDALGNRAQRETTEAELALLPDPGTAQ